MHFRVFRESKTIRLQKKIFNTNQCLFAFAQGCHGSYWSPIQQLLLVLPHIFANTKSTKICGQTNQLTNHKVFQTRCVRKISEEKFTFMRFGDKFCSFTNLSQPFSRKGLPPYNSEGRAARIKTLFKIIQSTISELALH